MHVHRLPCILADIIALRSAYNRHYVLPASPNCSNAKSFWLIISLLFMQSIPRSGYRLYPAFMRTGFYFHCATLSYKQSETFPHPCCCKICRLSASSVIVSQASVDSQQVHAAQTTYISNFFVGMFSGQHRATIISLAPSSLRLMWHLHHLLTSFAFRSSSSFGFFPPYFSQPHGSI